MTPELNIRRTSADVVIESLHARIVALELPPGTKMSEAEVASDFNVSRQPVRDAFSRLGDLGFLLIRPQRATIVKPFSLPALSTARFVRLAIETEVMRRLAHGMAVDVMAPLNANLEHQTVAADAVDIDAFHDLDTDFHRLLCLAAGQEGAVELLQTMKSQGDRICKLSLNDGPEMWRLITDHQAILGTVGARDEDAALTAIRHHLTRLDTTVERVHAAHSDLFED